MPDRKIKVLVVDDSSFMRLLIGNLLQEEPGVEVVDSATDGKEAVEKVLALRPDVVLLDLVMNNYDGLYAVRRIMQEQPTPILILSSIGNVNPDAVVEALNAGAYDFLNKPEGVMGAKLREIKAQLIGKIKTAAGISIEKLLQPKQTNTNPHQFDGELQYHILAIGASTGGTGALEDLLQKLPSNLPIPVVVAQHMPAEFVHSFASRLDQLLPVRVTVAQLNEPLRPNRIYLMPGDANTFLARSPLNGKVSFKQTDKLYTAYNFPSVDCLFESVAEVYGAKTVAVILTGMGQDGTLGMGKIFEKGGYTIAQDEASSVVFGMPRSAIMAGVVHRVLALKEIPAFVIESL